jgi:DNA (cytosine-5)-methyltransferase 1
MMSEVNKCKLQDVQASGDLTVGTIYKRTRPTGDGCKTQRAEVRFDEISGCLRTPAGGSSRQIVLIVEGNNVRSRLLSPREAARLMGAPEDYPIPENYNEAYHLFGDGLVVPVVSWLEKHLLYPIAISNNDEIINANVA